MTSTASAPSSSKTTLAHLALLIPWIALVINAYEKIIDNSYLWHIRAGTVQISDGAILTVDPFSFTMSGESWLTQSWLAEVGYSWLEGRFGLGFTAPLVLVASLLTLGGVQLIAFRFSRSVMTTAIIGLFSAVILPRFLAPRPVIFTYVLLVLVILVWEDRRLRWCVPLLFWLWAGLHGGFVVGLAYVVLRTVMEREWRRGGVVILASGVATLMTAHGVGVVTMLTDFAGSSEYLKLISEWQSPNLVEPDLLPFVMAIFIVIWGATKGRVVANDLWILAPFLLFAFSSQRSVGLAWIALVPLMSKALGIGPTPRSVGFSRPVTVVLTVLILVLPFVIAEGSELDSERFPVTAAQSMAPVRTFHGDAVGGYLIWDRFEPGVFVDDRVELYGPRIEEMVEVKSALRDWAPVFGRDGIEQALLSIDDPLVESLGGAGWSETYRDERFVVLVSPLT